MEEASRARGLPVSPGSQAQAREAATTSALAVIAVRQSTAGPHSTSTIIHTIVTARAVRVGLFGPAGLGHHGDVATTAGWTWAQTALLLAGLVSVAGALISVALTYGLHQRAARRERHSRVFAEALTAIEDYAEMPYRIRRRPRELSAQHELTEQISQIQSRIAFHQAWLWMEAPSVAEPYAELVRATKAQAGTQMKEAWLKPTARKAAQFNLTVAYDRDKINAARSRCIDAMRGALGRGRLPAPSPGTRAGPAGPAVTAPGRATQ